MTLQLHIVDSVAQAIRLPAKRMEDDLLVELAVALYAQEALSFGKARELAGMSRYEFGQLLGKRQIARHYGLEELEDDLRYASSSQYIAASQPGNHRFFWPRTWHHHSMFDAVLIVLPLVTPVMRPI